MIWEQTTLSKCRWAETFYDGFHDAEFYWEESTLGESGSVAFFCRNNDGSFTYGTWHYNPEMTEFDSWKLRHYHEMSDVKRFLREQKAANAPGVKRLLEVMKPLVTGEIPF